MDTPLIVVAIVLITAAIAIPNLLRVRRAANESSVVAA
jgi:type II secretory pathway pseudopilin PulG